MRKIHGKWYDLADDTQVKVEWNDTNEYKIENELKKGQIKIIKIDLENQTIKLQGVKFDILDEKGNVLETIITDSNGEAITLKYPIRDFEKLIIKEKETLQNYSLNETPQTIILEENKIKDVIFTNEVKKGQIKVIKEDKDNQEIKLEGVEFNILDSKGNIVDKLITDSNGEAISKRLRIDEDYYTIQEVKTLENYILTETPQIIKLEEDKITDIKFKNEKRKGQIKVIKKDGETKKPLEGVCFEILDSTGKKVGEMITDSNGQALSERLPIDEKEYTIREKSTLKAYILSEEIQTVELTENEITTVEFENYKKRGSIKIKKTSSDGIIEGISFKVCGTDDTGEYFEQVYVTDSNGEIKIDKICVGQYTISEIFNEENNKYIVPEEQIINVEYEKVIEVSFFNQLIETPKTGDERNTIIWFTLLGISIITLTSLGVYKIVKKKRR